MLSLSIFEIMRLNAFMSVLENTFLWMTAFAFWKVLELLSLNVIGLSKN
jgi:hypothetical protein